MTRNLKQLWRSDTLTANVIIINDFPGYIKLLKIILESLQKWWKIKLIKKYSFLKHNYPAMLESKLCAYNQKYLAILKIIQELQLIFFSEDMFLILEKEEWGEGEREEH